jgi:hypothetical protein
VAKPLNVQSATYPRGIYLEVSTLASGSASKAHTSGFVAHQNADVSISFSGCGRRFHSSSLTAWILWRHAPSPFSDQTLFMFQVDGNRSPEKVFEDIDAVIQKLQSGQKVDQLV